MARDLGGFGDRRGVCMRFANGEPDGREVRDE